jgi:hypothetical protein
MKFQRNRVCLCVRQRSTVGTVTIKVGVWDYNAAASGYYAELIRRFEAASIPCGSMG